MDSRRTTTGAGGSERCKKLVMDQNRRHVSAIQLQAAYAQGDVPTTFRTRIVYTWFDIANGRRTHSTLESLFPMIYLFNKMLLMINNCSI